MSHNGYVISEKVKDETSSGGSLPSSCAHHHQDVHPEQLPSPGPLIFFLNGEKTELPPGSWDVATTLSDYLRSRKTGPLLRATKIGCGEGGCGACAVVISKGKEGPNPNHRETCLAINSCLRPLGSLHGWSITTVEGLGTVCSKGNDNKAHPIQTRLSSFNATQCGFCTPGFVASLYAQLHAAQGGQSADKSQLAGCLDGNICRCTGYRPILDAAASFTKTTSVVDVEDMADQIKSCLALDEASEAALEKLGPYEVTKHDPPSPVAAYPTTNNDGMIVLEGKEGARWYQPRTLDQVWQVLQAYPPGKAKLIAGNTSTGVYKEGDALIDATVNKVLVSLQDVTELRGYEVTTEGWFVLGAGMTLSEFILILKQLPSDQISKDLSSSLLVHLRRIAGTLVRNAGSVGGNLHMARVKGFDSDLSTLMGGLGANVVVSSSPGAAGEKEMSLINYLQRRERDEEEASSMLLLKQIRFPLKVMNGSSNNTDLFRSYRASLRRSNSHAFANAAFRAMIDTRDGRFLKLYLCIGAQGKPAVRATMTEEALIGQELNETTLQAALIALRKELIPATKTQYRYRIELLSSFLYKFFLAAKEQVGPLDARLTSAAVPQMERPVLESEQKYSRRWMEGEEGGTAHAPLVKDYRGTQGTGEAVYVSDLPELEGTLYCAYVKSPRSVGILDSIKVDDAIALPGVEAVLTAADVPGLNDAGFYFGLFDTVPDTIMVPIGSKVLFHSQPVAIVVATSQALAERAAKLVTVTFDGFEAPIITIGDARDAGSSTGLTDQIKRGDAAAVLDKAKASTENEPLGYIQGKVQSGSQKHFYLETQTAYAIPDEGRMTVYSATQAPQCVQEVVARCLGMSMNTVHVKMRRAGGAFGGKATRNLPHACAAAVAAKVLKRPARFTLDRHTDMQLTGGRHPMEAEYEAAFDSDTGLLQALRCQVWFNGGFTRDLSFTVAHDFAQNLEMAYYIPHVDASIEVLRTNLPSSTTMRAPGTVQASFLMESVMDHLATVTGLVPEEVRRVNFFRGDAQAPTMQALGCLHGPPSQVSHFTLPEIWTQLSASAQVDRRRQEVDSFNANNRWKKRGVCMTPVKFHCVLMPMCATINAYPDGSLLIHHGGCEIGQGIHAKSAVVALQALADLVDEPITLEMIRFADTDTDNLPNGGYTAASTTSERACAAVNAACQEMIKRLLPIRDRLRQEMRAKSETSGGEAPASLSWRELIKTALSFGHQVDLCCHAQWRPSTDHYHNYGAAVSEVEIDVLTGEVEIRAAHLLYDCGKSINPAADLGQVEGAFVQGLGFYLLEEALIASDGTLQSPGTWEYKTPMLADLPQDWQIELLENGNFDKGFLSSKASGEPPLVLSTSVMMAVRAAVLAARSDAGFSKTFKLDVPATPERIHRACGTSMGLMELTGQAMQPRWLDETPRQVQVAVAGAGLGGLAAAIALSKLGIDAALFERAPALRDVSQGLVGVTPNGIRALELIEPKIKEYLHERGKYNTEAFTKTIDDQGGITERIVKFEANNVSIPWADIQHSLARLVPKSMINCSHDFAGFIEDEDGVTIYFKGRVETVRAELLIGVDGLFSLVRKAIVPFPDGVGDEVCESGHTNWNAIMNPEEAGLPYPHPVVSLTYQKEHPPRFFFMIECGHGRILWQVRVNDPEKEYTVAPKKGHGRLGLEGVKQRILDLVEDVPDVLPYIKATPEETIFERCLLFRKSLLRYSSLGRRVTLLGDAAHAMHSVRGQGANMCFEDAHCMLLSLAAKGVGPQAIRIFERARIPRANLVQWESNTYYKRQFERNTDHSWALKFLNFQSYVREVPETLPPELVK